jgi:hypothetical protein
MTHIHIVHTRYTIISRYTRTLIHAILGIIIFAKLYVHSGPELQNGCYVVRRQKSGNPPSCFVCVHNLGTGIPLLRYIHMYAQLEYQKYIAYVVVQRHTADQNNKTLI